MPWAPFLAFATLPVAQWHQPLDVRNQRSVSAAFLRLAPRSHTALEGEEVFSYSLTGANEFRQGAQIDEDAETWRLSFAYGRGLGDGLEAFAEVPLVARGGGFMDPLIEWWHDHVINRPDPVRNSTPQGRAVIGEFGDAFGIGDLALGLGKRLDDRTLLRFAIKAPTGDASKLLGSGAFDVALAADYRLPLARNLTLDLNGGVAFQGKATHIEDSESTVFFSAIALTYAQSSRDAWTVQLNSEQMPSETGTNALDKDHRILSFGYQRLLNDGSLLQLYFSEDGDFLHFPGGPTLGPDFTVGLRLVTRQ